MEPNRYLTSFDSRKELHRHTDVLIIGAGIAGIRSALEFQPEYNVLVITKDKLQESNSSYAQGGIAGVLSNDDTFENHIEDTHIAGAGLCVPEIVERVIREAPEQINDLIRFGTQFDLENGSLALTREGGHSHRRIVHALGDSTGFEVMRALITRAKATPNIELWDNAFTLDLITMDGICMGVIVHRPPLGRIIIWAKQVILASGGCGMIYRETTNPPVATGDGMAAAFRAGATLRDMEFMQFHPTVLYVAGASRYLISEALRGEGAYLRDVNGARFMLGEDSRAELAPRDVVSRAIFRCMERTQHPNVYLDLSHLETARVYERFPGIAKVCQGFGIDIAKDKIPVRPGAHYMIGGLSVDPEGRTSIPGLWAAGEVTSSGLHGANRLASNSLIEGLVYGTSAARGAMTNIERMSRQLHVPTVFQSRPKEDSHWLDLADMKNSLRSLMVRKMGIVRREEKMLDARKDVLFWSKYALVREFSDRDGWELQNLLTVAAAMIHNALTRKESRGTHFRSDYPESLDQWKKQIETPSLQELFG